MSQPPDETPQEGWRDEAWQPPGPGSQPSAQQPGQGSGPPYGQNPYGGGSTIYYRPNDSGGMSSSVKVVLGVVIGIFGGFFLWFVAAIGFGASSAGDGNGFLFLAAVTPLVVPAPLLIWKATRPWAAGLLIGTAVASVGMSSLCSAMISSFEGGA
jgi:hypothetical protein